MQYQYAFDWGSEDLPEEEIWAEPPVVPVELNQPPADASTDQDFLEFYASFLGVSETDRLSWQTQNFRLGQHPSSAGNTQEPSKGFLAQKDP
ncbi:MAG: hypothetical protein VKJ24_14290 [Synechococcales bacterium]|nr:hypothetical protein [Synechococcales bacterium]